EAGDRRADPPGPAVVGHQPALRRLGAGEHLQLRDPRVERAQAGHPARRARGGAAGERPRRPRRVDQRQDRDGDPRRGRRGQGPRQADAARGAERVQQELQHRRARGRGRRLPGRSARGGLRHHGLRRVRAPARRGPAPGGRGAEARGGRARRGGLRARVRARGPAPESQAQQGRPGRPVPLPKLTGRMGPRPDRHPLDLACGAALAVVSIVDFYTARSLTLVAYVQPHVVFVVQVIENTLSVICAGGVLLVVVAWRWQTRAAHRRLTYVVLALQTLGLSLDVAALFAGTIFGHRANPVYLLLEAALVHTSTVFLFSAWYATIDHHRQVARAEGRPSRVCFSFPQLSARYEGYERWVPGYVDYLSLTFTASSSLAPAEALPLAASVKLLMVLQGSMSLVILLVLAARAIGLIA